MASERAVRARVDERPEHDALEGVDVAEHGRGAGEETPNILFILVDTLRRDHLTPYGYGRDTTPEIARWLAAPGAVLEDAYSQAPWTLPSVVSLLTGRSPGEMLGEELASYGIPEKVPTLAERLESLGYETGGFVANPTLHAGAGFERGFQTFYAPPADLAWMRRHPRGSADDVHVAPAGRDIAGQDRHDRGCGLGFAARIAVASGVAGLVRVVAVADQEPPFDPGRAVAEDDVGGDVGRLREPLANPSFGLDLELPALQAVDPPG